MKESFITANPLLAAQKAIEIWKRKQIFSEHFPYSVVKLSSLIKKPDAVACYIKYTNIICLVNCSEYEIIAALNHEFLHHVLMEFVGFDACNALDNKYGNIKFIEEYGI